MMSSDQDVIMNDDRLLSGLQGTERDLWHQLIVAITIGAAAVFALVSGLTQKLIEPYLDI